MRKRGGAQPSPDKTCTQWQRCAPIPPDCRPPPSRSAPGPGPGGGPASLRCGRSDPAPIGGGGVGPAQGRVRRGRDGTALSTRQSRVGVVGAGGRDGGSAQQEGQRHGPEIRRGRGRRWHLRWVWGAVWSPAFRRPSLGHHPGSAPGHRPAPRAAGGTGARGRGAPAGQRGSRSTGSGGGSSLRLALKLGLWLTSVGFPGASDLREKRERNIPVPVLSHIRFFLCWFVLRAYQKRVCRKTGFIMSTGAGECRDTGWDFCLARNMTFLSCFCSTAACILLINSAESHLGISVKTCWVLLPSKRTVLRRQPSSPDAMDLEKYLPKYYSDSDLL